MICAHEGCDRGIATGHGLYRISPKGRGEKFVGVCQDHLGDLETPSDSSVLKITQTFEQENAR